MGRKTAVFKGIIFNKYEVDEEDGQIYRKGKDKHLIGFDNGHGYDLIDMMSDDGVRVRCKRHFIVAHTYLGPQPTGTIIQHLNGNKKDCRPINLEYDTQKNNVAHAQRLVKGKMYYTDIWDKVDAMRKEGKKIIQISNELGVPYWVIRDKLYGKTYK